MILDRAQIPCLGGSFPVAYTPIGLSGPSRFDAAELISREHDWIKDNSLAAGFIQTRERTDEKSFFSVVDDGNFTIYQDARTNYRLELGLSMPELCSIMKRDSRQRVRKFLQNRSTFKLVPCGIEFDEGVARFASMYKALSEKQNFNPLYCFEMKDWMSLLSSDCWTLFLLYYETEIIAGTVVARLPHGHDYTYMACDPSYPDASRGVIALLYEYLTLHSAGSLDLGGGIGEGDKLAKFKMSMGAAPVAFKRIKFLDNRYVANDVNMDSVRQIMTGRWPG